MAEPMRPSPMNPICISVAPAPRASGSSRRRHELRCNGIGDRRGQNAIDPGPGRGIERPARKSERSAQLVGVTATPERHADTLVEHPTHCQLNHAPMEQALCELIELPNGVEILRVARRLQLRMNSPRISASDAAVRQHAAAQKPGTQRSVAEGRTVVRETVREYR